jgi:hypothetical protein
MAKYRGLKKKRRRREERAAGKARNRDGGMEIL